MRRKSAFLIGMACIAFELPFASLWGQETTSETAATQQAAETPNPTEPVEQDPAVPNDAGSAASAAARAKAAFDQKFQEYKAIIREIEKLQVEYQAADAAQRESINAAMTGQVAHAQSVINEMVEAGVEAFRLAPDDTPQIREFLIAVVRHYVAGRQPPGAEGPIQGGDQYERALPIIKALVEGGVENHDLFLWGFLCAFVTNDYDLAENYLKMAQATPPDENEESPPDAAKDETLGLIAKFVPLLPQYRQWWEVERKLREAEAAADDLPRVKLTTTKGEITLELFENEAPQTVANFISLVKQSYYDGLPFHRVIAKFMAQGGAKNDDGSGRLGYSIRGEASVPNYRRHFRGSLSMGLLPGNPNSGGSQFFLTMVPTPHLDGQHTVFGRVIEGIEVLADLNRRQPSPDPQANATIAEPDRILKAEVLRDRGHDYAFERLPEP
jgi:cyclophilin family peptidyl-prolyl cis-trans isomerase